MTQYDKDTHQIVIRCLNDLYYVACPTMDGNHIEDLMWIARMALMQAEAQMNRLRDAEREAEIARGSPCRPSREPYSAS